MCKYKDFVVILGISVLAFIVFCFTLSYDGNDDQAMQFIASGALTGHPDYHLIFQHIFIGKLLIFLYHIFAGVNWYLFFFVSVHCFSFFLVAISFSSLEKKRGVKYFIALLAVCILGFQALFITALQFTSTAYMAGIAGLFCLSGNLSAEKKIFLAVTAFAVCMLIRAQVFTTLIPFAVLIILYQWKNKRERNISAGILAGVCALSFAFSCINNYDHNYVKTGYYKKIKAYEILINRPITVDEGLLHVYGYTEGDLSLIRQWYGADTSYLRNPKLDQLASALLTHRNSSSTLLLLKQYVADERYTLLMYACSLAGVLLFCRRKWLFPLLNLLVFAAIIDYLAMNMRIPRRVTMPLMFYITLLNYFFIIRYSGAGKIKNVFWSVAILLSLYKFYCVYKLSRVNMENAVKFEAARNEVNSHPGNLFIALQFPLEYMSAKFKNENIFPGRNVIFAGWYINTPDYWRVLNQHHLDNLTVGLVNREDILFLTDSELFQETFAQVMLQRYHIHCHFEDVQQGFTYLHPKRLVVDP